MTTQHPAAACTHAPDAGACSSCCPWMFPTDEQMARTALWFQAYRFEQAKAELRRDTRTPKYDRRSVLFEVR